MITNEVQRRTTETHLRQFEEAIANLEAKHPVAENRSKLAKLEIEALRSQAADLHAELDEYDRLRSGDVSTFEAASIEELATLLIKARIARGWTQRRLADQLGIAHWSGLVDGLHRDRGAEGAAPGVAVAACRQCRARACVPGPVVRRGQP